MFDQRAVKLVHQNIDGGIHIRLDGFNVQVFAGQMGIHLGFVLQFVYRKGYGYGNQVARMAVDALQLAGNILFDGFGYIEIQTGDFQVHSPTPYGGLARPSENPFGLFGRHEN